MGSICGGGEWGSMGRRQLCTYMYDVKSSSGVVVDVCGTYTVLTDWHTSFINTAY